MLSLMLNDFRSKTEQLASASNVNLKQLIKSFYEHKQREKERYMAYEFEVLAIADMIFNTW